MRKVDSVCLLLLLGLAPVRLLAAAPATAVTAIAKGDCAVAVNASGQAVVTVTASCDKQTAATVQKLLEQQAEQRRKNAQVDKRQSGTEQDVAAMQRQIAELTAAVKTINAQAQQADASTAQKQAAAKLRAGQPELAIVQLGLAADKEAAASASKAQNAAALYRQQAALLATRDVKQALAAYQKALALEPGDYLTLWDAGDMAQAVGDSALALKLYRQMQQVVQKELATTPQSAAWQRELVSSHIKIGDMQQAQGDGAGGAAKFPGGAGDCAKTGGTRPRQQ
jgi:tetratricopeptide (TPR) repeat protein